MRVLATRRALAERIEPFDSHGAWSLRLGQGAGDCHVYALHFDAPGEIGPHEAGFDQLLVVTAGSGWAAGPDGRRVALSTGQVAPFRKGELHSKGSDEGMTAIMIQASRLAD